MSQTTIKVTQQRGVDRYDEKYISRIFKQAGIEGIEIRAFGSDRDDLLLITQHGLLGELKASNDPKITILVSAPNNPKVPVSAFIVDNNKIVTFKKGEEIYGESGPRIEFKLPVQLKTANIGSNKGITHPQYPFNAIRLLVFKTQQLVEMFEIGLISQEGNFFIFVQNAYTIQLFKNNEGKIVCPIFYDRNIHRPTFEKAVVDTAMQFDITAEKLPLESDYIKNVFSDQQLMLQQTAKLPDNNNGLIYGYVAFYNPIQRLGMLYVKGEPSPVSVHESNLIGYGQTRSKPLFLTAGDTVSIKRTIQKRNTTRKGSSFQKQAIGVKKL